MGIRNANYSQTMRPGVFSFVSSSLNAAMMTGEQLKLAQTQDTIVWVGPAHYNLRRVRWLNLDGDGPKYEDRLGPMSALEFREDATYHVLCVGMGDVCTLMAIETHPPAPPA